MKRTIWLSLLSLLGLAFSTVSYAGPLAELVGDPVRTITASGHSVKIYPKARLHAEGMPAEGVELKLTGAGIYYKKVLGAQINANVSISYVDNPNGIDPNAPLESLAASPHKLIVIVALRNLNQNEIRSTFEDALDANDVTSDDPGIQDLLDFITFDIPSGNYAYLANVVGSSSDRVIIETGSLHHVAQGEGLGLNLWKSWFGETFDDGSESLKPQLMSGH